MDAIKVQDLLDLIERAKVPLPDGEPISDRNLAIIAKAEADIDAELLKVS